MAPLLKPQPNITLYRGTPGPGAYVWSPFATKLEARLRFGGLSYRIENGSPLKAPRGKIPYVELSKAESGSQPPAAPTTLGDSTLIIKSFIQDGLLSDLNAKLSPTEKAQDLAIRALLEDKLYFYQVWERWQQNYYTMRSEVFAPLPYPMQVIVGLIAHRKITQTLYGQGTGRLSAEEISMLRHQAWESVNALLVEAKKNKSKEGLGEGVFWVLGGNEPTEADAVLFAFVATGVICAAAPDTRKEVKSFPTVEDYARRIHNRYFPDYAKWD